MFRSYVLLALRNIRRQPGYAFLNILGLTLGIAATLFILLFMTEELSYDKYHEKADRIYRVSSDITEPDDAFRWAVTQTPLAMQLKEDYPEVEQYVRFIPNGRTRLVHGERNFYEEDVYVVDSTVCEVFSFDFIYGEEETALVQPNSIALSESVSRRIFGDANPIGETLRTASDNDYQVTGVYRDMPSHSHLIASAMISSNGMEQLSDPSAGSWGGFWMYTYVLLHEGTDPADFEVKLQEVIDQYVAVIFDEFDIEIKYELLPLTSIHLYSDFEGEPEPTGDISFLYIFGAVAFFIILIACINYMNLATARSTRRAMEVGVRKVLGSRRKYLIWQFLSESIFFTILAGVLSYGLVYLLLPLFNSTFDLQLGRELLWSPEVLVGLLVVLVIAGIGGGSYPAFYLSGFKPITVLKGKLSRSAGNPQLRKGLVALQFAITLFMLVGTGIIYDQMQYLRNKELGFDKENVMTFRLQGQDAREQYPVIRQKLLQNPDITGVGTASSTPGGGFGKNLITLETEAGPMDQYGVDQYAVDFEYFPTLGMELSEGRFFSRDRSTDSTAAVLVNEAMVRRMAWQDPIGKKVQLGANDTLPVMRVIGVVRDFHQRSLYEPIEALMFIPRFNNPVVHVRLDPDDRAELSSLISFVEREWKNVFPGRPFEFEFMDTAFMELYEEDQIRAKIFTLFSILMILIACLGLLGLASFTAEQRTKEIGVRKILGAETTDIVYLLTRNFVVLVVLAAIPAFIAAWYFMSRWLDTFHYHTSMNFWLYGIALVVVVLITLLTTGYFALRAANRNPVKALRYE